MVSRTDEEGVQVDYEYDALNRLTRQLKNGPTSAVEKYTYDGLSRLSVAKKGTTGNDDAVSQSSFTYDNLSRVVTESQAIAEGSAKNVIYTYDKGGNRITMNGSSGLPYSAYAYDSRDRCSGIDQHNGSAWVDLADYTWLGGAISKRETICDYVGNSKPKFKTAFQRDGILRVTGSTQGLLRKAACGSREALRRCTRPTNRRGAPVMFRSASGASHASRGASYVARGGGYPRTGCKRPDRRSRRQPQVGQTRKGTLARRPAGPRQPDRASAWMILACDPRP